MSGLQVKKTTEDIQNNAQNTVSATLTAMKCLNIPIDGFVIHTDGFVITTDGHLIRKVNP